MASCKAETSKESIKTKTESGNCFCIRVVLSINGLDSLSCLQIWNIVQEKDREKEKVGGRPVKLNEKKGDRDLEREIKKRGNFFDERTT